MGTVMFDYENQPVWLDFLLFCSSDYHRSCRCPFSFSPRFFFSIFFQHGKTLKKAGKKTRQRRKHRRLHSLNKLHHCIASFYFNIWLERGVGTNRISWTQCSHCKIVRVLYMQYIYIHTPFLYIYIYIDFMDRRITLTNHWSGTVETPNFRIFSLLPCGDQRNLARSCGCCQSPKNALSP